MNTPPAVGSTTSPMVAARTGFFNCCISPKFCLEDGRPGEVRPIVARLPTGTPPMAAAEKAKVLLEALQISDNILYRVQYMLNSLSNTR